VLKDLWTGQWIQLVGWLLMVSGFTLVLYSRLYLVIINPRLRAILLPTILTIVVLTNFVVFLLIFVVNGLRVAHGNHSNKAYTAAWRLQLLSPIEEAILAGLYVFFFVRLLKDSSLEDSHFRKTTFYLLCIAQAIIIICDALIIVLNYKRLILLRTMLYPVLYAFKLEFEIVVLNRLIHITSGRKTRIPAILNVETRQPDGPEKVMETTSPHSLTSSDDTAHEIVETYRNSIDEMERRYLGRV